MGVVTGVFQYANGSPVANGAYQWKLSSDAIQFSTASNCTVPTIINGNLDSNGNMTSTFAFNDVLSTTAGAVTSYQLTVKGQNGGQVWNEVYYLTGSAANLNLIPPSGGVPVIPVTVTSSAVSGGAAQYTAVGNPGFFGPGIPQTSLFVIDQGNFASLPAGTTVFNQIQGMQFNLDATWAIRKVTQMFAPGAATNTSAAVLAFSIWDQTASTKLLDTGPITNNATVGVTSTAVATISPPVTLTAGPYWFFQTTNLNNNNLQPFGYANINNTPPFRISQMINSNANRFAVAASSSSGGVFPASLGSLTALTASSGSLAYLLFPFFEP